MQNLGAIKLKHDDLEIEYEILPAVDTSNKTDSTKRGIELALGDIDGKIQLCEEKVEQLNVEIDKLTNHADGLDYTIAVVSGVLTGLIDSFFVGDFNPSVEDVVTNFAKIKSGGKVTDYEDAQKYLQDKYHTANDGAYISNKMGIGAPTHRLDDIAHHPTIIGLVAYIFSCYFKRAIFVDRNGKWHLAKIELSSKELLKAWGPAILTGLLMWLSTIAERYSKEKIELDLPEPLVKLIKYLAYMPSLIQIFKYSEVWYGHIMSDVSTKEGIPGIFLSFLKEIASLPILKDTKLSELVWQMFREGKFTFASEITTIEKIKRQAIPVIINELIVRGFYFVRHLIQELNENKKLDDVNWQKVIPFGNRTVERMMTIASGTFCAVDVADAAIRSGGFNPGCLLRVNFVGIGRFVIAIGVDIGMGIKRNKLISERRLVMAEELNLLNAKVFYKCAIIHCEELELANAQKDCWITAEDTVATLTQATQAVETGLVEYRQSINEFYEDLQAFRNNENINKDRIEAHNSGLTRDLLNQLKWGKK